MSTPVGHRRRTWAGLTASADVRRRPEARVISEREGRWLAGRPLTVARVRDRHALEGRGVGAE